MSSETPVHMIYKMQHTRAKSIAKFYLYMNQVNLLKKGNLLKYAVKITRASQREYCLRKQGITTRN